MTLAPFHQFMDAVDRDIERRRFNERSYKRMLSCDELEKLTEAKRKEYWSRNGFGVPREPRLRR